MKDSECSNRDSAHLKRAGNLNRHIFMESQKIYLAGNGGTDVSALLASALQNRGVDPNILAVMGNRNGGVGGWGGNDFFAILLLFILMGAWGNNGWGGGFGGGNNGGLPLNMLSNDSSRELIMSAIQRNGVDISQLASTLNCSIGQVTAGTNAMATQISTLAGQQGMSAQQIINSIQAGNCQLTAQLAQCCCDVRTAIERQGYESQLATLNQTNTLTNAANTQFNVLGSKIDAQTQIINDKFCQLEMREMQNKLDAERAKSAALAGQLSQEHQTATIMQAQAQAVAPVNAAIGDLSSRLAKIECGLPPTTVVPNPQVYAMPACVSAQFGLGFGAGYGFGGNGFWG